MPCTIRKYTLYALLALLLCVGLSAAVVPDTMSDDGDETPGIASVEPTQAEGDGVEQLSQSPSQFAQPGPPLVRASMHYGGFRPSLQLSAFFPRAISLLATPLRP